MALPNLQDDLPPGDLNLLREAHGAYAALVKHEQRLAFLEKRAADLSQAIDRLVDELADRLGLTENDLVAVFNDLSQSASRLQADLLQSLQEAEPYRESISEWRDESLKARTLALFDREAEVLRSALAAYESGQHRLLVLRDKLLVREGEEMSLPTFWGDDDR